MPVTSTTRPNVSEIESILLDFLERGVDSRLGIGTSGIIGYAMEQFPEGSRPMPTVVSEAVCGLLARRLAYIDYSTDSGTPGGNHADPAKWWLYPTERGRKSVQERLPNPDLHDKYLQEFATNIPQASDLVILYLKEALRTYNDQSYIASAVMLGVAAEAAFMEMIEAFCSYLTDKEAENLRKGIESSKSTYSRMLDEFRKRLEPKKAQLPIEVHDKIDLQLVAVLDLIRRYRNDSGHPSGFKITRAECHQSLVCFVEAVRRLYALKAEFDKNTDK